MAIVALADDVDMTNLNLNRLSANLIDATLLDGAFITFSGTTYEDVYIVDWYFGGYRASVFGGYGIEIDNLKNITGGTVTGYLELGWSGSTYVPYFTIDGISANARSLYGAALTSATADDRALFVQFLSGDDQILGSNYNDVLEGHAGNDVLRGNGGDDVIYGGEGIDTAQYLASSSINYFISSSDDGLTITVRSASEGEDQLIGVELIEFSNGVYTISDLITSTSAAVSNDLDVIVDLFGNVSMLKGLTEFNDGLAHTLTYNGVVFNYSDVDALLTTVVRNGEFTVEFAQEIADAYPSVAGISYSTVIGIVGAAEVDGLLISVAGVDGSYIT